MRRFLLRLLIGWWVIPCIWLWVLPFGYLITGEFKKEVKEVKGISKMLWYGL